MVETKMYIGLNDSETKIQKFETSRYLKLLIQVCKEYEVAFSFQLAEGGYIHEDGTFTQENSIILSFIDTPKELIDQIAKDICVFFNQESVLITEDKVRTRSVRESIAD